MLIRLHVRDFAIVDQIDVDLAAGMTVLTGETGAGKSILVDALGLVLGDRGNAQMVRPGARRAEFSAEFDVTQLPGVAAWLENNDLDDGNECLVRRVIGEDGRSRGYINGQAVTIAQLKDLGERLVDIHGQHFHQSLGREAVQRDLLDHFGSLQGKAQQTATAFAEWQAVNSKLAALRDANANRNSRVDLLAFQQQELDALALVAGEFESLQAERKRIGNSSRIADGLNDALANLTDNETANASALLANAARQLQNLVEFDESLQPLADLIDSASIQASEAADDVRRYTESLEHDPVRRDEVEQRLDALYAMARKHRSEPEQLISLREDITAELAELQHADEISEELERQVETCAAQFEKAAKTLSRGRRKAAKQLGAAVTEAMQGLGMPGGRFEVAISQRDPGSERASGLDDIGFLISANPGQPLLPMAKIASGGELSRMSLAIQVIASDGSNIPTMVFDEVDSGVGGGVAEMVGRRLAELGKTRQVLCVTHLPQVASLANEHFRISKVSDGKATRTNAINLNHDERVEELARMLGGVEITKKTLAHAAEMLAGSPKKRA